MTPQTCPLWDIADICCFTQRTDAKLWLCFAGGGEVRQAPSACSRKPGYVTSAIYITRISRCVAGGPSMPPSSSDTNKTTMLCHKQSSEPTFMIYCGINHLSWNSTPAFRQKLRIGKTSSAAHDLASGMGLDEKLTARDPTCFCAK